MGLLKNIVSTAVNDGIRKGVSNAVGKAIESAIKPAADNLANKTAQAVNSAADEVNKGLAETKAAATEAGAAMAEANAAAGAAASEVKSLGGLAGLESALSGWAASAERIATQMSSSMKICPSCGQPSPADKAYCPHCGAKLPDKTLGEDYTCSKCGTANTPGTKFCSACGAILPAAAAEIEAQQAKDATVLAEFENLLPQFPKWTVGGSEFRLEANGEANGYPIYDLELVGGHKELDAYIALLNEAGFRQSGDQWYKTIDGACRTFDCNDAVIDGGIYVHFFVSTLDKKAEPKPAEDPLADLKGAAKGIFKKFLG